MTDDFRQRLGRRISKWIRKNALAPVEVGCSVMVIGVLISCGMTYELARRLTTKNDLPNPGAELNEFMAMWGASLAIIFAGNLWCVLGSPEHESSNNTEGSQHSAALALVLWIKRSGILAFIVGLMMTFWGSLAAVSIAFWFRLYFSGMPGPQWVAGARRAMPQTLTEVSLSWLVATALAAGGLALMWNGIQRHDRVHAPRA